MDSREIFLNRCEIGSVKQIARPKVTFACVFLVLMTKHYLSMSVCVCDRICVWTLHYISMSLCLTGLPGDEAACLSPLLFPQ